MSFQIGIVNLIVIVGAILFLFLKTKSTKKPKKLIYLLSLLLSFWWFFDEHPIIFFIWNINPFTNAIQFPWRLLSLTTILTTTLFVYVSKFIPGKYLRLVSLIIAVSAFSLTISYFRPGEITNNTDEYFLRRYLPNKVLLAGEQVSKRISKLHWKLSSFTHQCRQTGVRSGNKITSILSGTKINISDLILFPPRQKLMLPVMKLSLSTLFSIQAGTLPSIINRQTLLWIKMVPWWYSFPRVHSLDIKFLDTPIRRISNIISLASWLIVIFLLTKQAKLYNRGKRRWA